MSINSNGMELSNISKDDPAEVLLFVAINHQGNMFAFVNKLTSFNDFHQHWQPVRHLLQPMTFHCVRARGWNTASSTGQTFEILDHICEFGSIHQARASNARYLQTWTRWVDSGAAAEDVRAATTTFVKGLKALGDLNRDALASYDASLPSDEHYIWALEFVADTLEAPDTLIEIDAETSTNEWLDAFIAWNDKETQ